VTRGAGCGSPARPDLWGAGEATRRSTRPFPTFTGGQDVLAAGEIAAKEGWVQRVSNESGHYRPDATSNLQALQALDKMGVNLDAAAIENVTFDKFNQRNAETFQARAVLATGNDEGLMRAHKDTFAGIWGGNHALKHVDAGRSDDAWWKDAYRTEGHNPVGSPPPAKKRRVKHGDKPRRSRKSGGSSRTSRKTTAQ
jgi:hypothetical protein